MNAADMLAPSEVLATHWRRPFLRWLNGIEVGWAIPLLLIGFIVVGLAALTIANLNGDLHPETLQAWSSGRSLEWGYAGQAPLAAWIARVWTTVFPLTNWSFRLLALTNTALALWVVDRISSRFVRGDRRVVVLLLLMLLPIYQFQAYRFDTDTVLLAIWPIASYCFLRSFETRQIGWAIAAGATAAMAMLGKYHSVFLIASFVVAAICHPQRRAYLTSLAPWVSAAVGFAALGPHMYWLATMGAKPFADMLGRLTNGASHASLTEGLLVMLVLASIVAMPLVIWGLMVPGRLTKLYQIVKIIEPGQLLLFLVSVGTIVLPAITAIGLGTGITLAWEFQGLYLAVILLVCGSSAPIERSLSLNLAVLTAAIAVLCILVAAPLHALYRNTHPFDQGRNFYHLSAAELTRQWHAHSAEPLSVVGGDRVLALAAAFYSPDHPVVEGSLVLPEAESVPPEAILRRGWASLCFDADGRCTASTERVAARASQYSSSEFTVESNLLGLQGVQQGFTALIVPRSAAAPPAAAPSPAIVEAPAIVPPSPPEGTPSVVAPPSVAEGPSVAPPPPVAEAPAVAKPSSVAEAPPAAEEPSAAASPSVVAEPPSVVASSPAEEKTPPPPASSAAEGSPEGAVVAAQPEKPDGMTGQSELVLPKISTAREAEKNRGRSAVPALVYKGSQVPTERAIAEYKLNWMRWAAAHQGAGCPISARGWQNPCCSNCWSAARIAAARWQLTLSSAGCASRGRGRRCLSALRMMEPVYNRGLDAPASFSGCDRSRADPSMSPPLLARLSRRLCDLAGFFEAHAHPQQRMPAGLSLLRTRASIAEPRLWRRYDYLRRYGDAGSDDEVEFLPE